MDDRFDDIIDSTARDYNEPPATPRDAMWQRIAAARAPLLAPATVVHIRPRRLAWGAGIAAVLALGIGIGRTMEHAAHSRSVGAPRVAAGTTEPHSSSELAAPSTRERSGELAVVDSASVKSPSTSATGDTPRSRTPRDVPAINADLHAPNSAASPAFAAVLNQHLGQSEAFLTLFRSSVRSGHTERLAATTARQLLSTNRLLLDSRAGQDIRSRQLLQDLELVLAQIAQLRTDGDSTDMHLITQDIEEGNVLPRLRMAVPAGI